MDINETLSLLQTQSSAQSPEQSPEQSSGKSQVNNEGDDVAGPDDTQQSTGEEFSTFLSLLTAQIQNQDPLAPLDSTQFVEQLATFTNLELQAKGNQSLDLIAALLIRQIELLSPAEDTSQNSAHILDTAT